MSWSISNAEAALQKKLQRPYKPLLPWLVSPLVQPEYVFCRDAIAIVGKAMFGDEWKEGDLLAKDWWESPEQIYSNHWSHELATNGNLARRISIPRSILSNDWGPTESSETEEDFERRKLEHFQHCTDALKAIPQSVADLQAEWQANADATQRLLKAIGWVGDKCRAGVIRGAYQFHNSYELKEDMNKQLWNCTSDAGHWAKAGGISFKGNDYTHHTWVFVHRGDMEREIESLQHAPLLVNQEDLSRLAPDLQLAVRLALKLKLFGPGVMGHKTLRGRIETEALAEGREVAPTKAVQIAATMAWPNPQCFHS